jgi:hypothetical protein
MIKFAGNVRGRSIFGVGLSRENCKRLLENKPIAIDLAATRLESTVAGTGIDFNSSILLIFGGDTEEEMEQVLKDNFDASDSLELGHDEEN